MRLSILLATAVLVPLGLHRALAADAPSLAQLQTMLEVRRCRELGAVVVLCTLNSVYPASSTYSARTWMVTAPRAGLARRIIAGYDVECIDRKAGDLRSPHRILLEWIRQWVGG